MVAAKTPGGDRSTDLQGTASTGRARLNYCEYRQYLIAGLNLDVLAVSTDCVRSTEP